MKASCMLTPADYVELKRVAKRLGFKSSSAMLSAITERLLIGGFSGMSFLKLGWQFSDLIAKQPKQEGWYFGVRPFPPLIGNEPDTQEIAEELKEFAAHEVENDLSKRAA